MSAVPAALLLAALPLAAAQPQVTFAAADSLLPFDDPAGYALPGIDHVRVAIPHGSLAGHAVIVLQVESRLAPRAALAEVERHWRAQGADTILQAQAGEWFVLSRRANAGHHPLAPDGVEGFETLQLRASRHGGSEGLLTQWNRAPEASNADALARLVPSGAHVVRQLSSGGDAQRKATTLVAYFARSLDDAERQLDRHLRAEGFEPMGPKGTPEALRWRDDRARFYRARSAELLVTLHRQPNGASAVLHHVETAR